MMDSRAAGRYARALFELAGRQNKLEKIEKNLGVLRTLVEKHPEINHLVLNSTISLREKEDFLEKIFTAETDPLLLHFLKLLVRKGRFQELETIQKVFHRLYEQARGVQEVRIITAAALSGTNEERLLQILKKKLGAEVRLIKEVDPSIIGGIILRFYEKEINASFKQRLEEISQLLVS